MKGNFKDGLIGGGIGLGLLVLNYIKDKRDEERKDRELTKKVEKIVEKIQTKTEGDN